MKRARVGVAATCVTSLLFAGAVLAAQAPQAPPMQSVLAGKKFAPPLRGVAQVEFTSSKPVREKDVVVEKFLVKNVSNGPIARLSIAETWYDKSGAVVTGTKGTVNGLLQPGEVQAVTLQTPWKAGMTSNQYVFSHVNGTVKPQRVAKLDAPPADATAQAGAKPPAAKPPAKK